MQRARLKDRFSCVIVATDTAVSWAGWWGEGGSGGCTASLSNGASPSFVTKK